MNMFMTSQYVILLDRKETKIVIKKWLCSILTNIMSTRFFCKSSSAIIGCLYCSTTMTRRWNNNYSATQNKKWNHENYNCYNNGMGNKLLCNIPSMAPVPSFNQVISITSNCNRHTHTSFTPYIWIQSLICVF
jgi:hypothetical protein